MKTPFILITLPLFFLSLDLSSQQTPSDILLLNENYDIIIKQLENKPILTENELLNLALSYRQTGHPDKAIAVMESKAEHSSPRYTKLLSRLYFETGSYDKALPLIKTIYETDRSDYRNFIRYTDILNFRKEYRLTIALLTTRLKTDSLNFEVNKRLGETYIRIDSLNQAAKQYEKLLSLYPENQVVAYKLAVLYLKIKEYRKSLNVCDTILAYSADNTKFLALKGKVYFNVNQYKNAIIVMKKLENLGDHSYSTQRILGISYFKNNNYTEAVSYLKNVLEIKPNDAIASYYLGASLANLPIPEEGIPYLKEAAEMLQPPAKVMEKIYYNLAMIYRKTEKFNLAVENLKKLMEYTPENIRYYLSVATIYEFNIKNNDEALKYYKKFISSLPPDPDPKKGNERYNIRLKKYAENRITKINENNFFEAKKE